MDDLLDYCNLMRRRVELLRDALSHTLAELPDGEPWREYADLFVLTDPELNESDDLELLEAAWELAEQRKREMVASYAGTNHP